MSISLTLHVRQLEAFYRVPRHVHGSKRFSEHWEPCRSGNDFEDRYDWLVDKTDSRSSFARVFISQVFRRHLQMLRGCIKAINGGSSVPPKMGSIRILSESRDVILVMIERSRYVWNTLENHEHHPYRSYTHFEYFGSFNRPLRSLLGNRSLLKRRIVI